MRARPARRLAALLLALPVLALAACGGDDEEGAGTTTSGTPAAEQAKPKVAVLLSVGLKDTGYGRSAFAGIEQIREELGNQVDHADLIKPADFATAMSDYAQRGYEIVIANGVEFQDAANRVAKQFPETRFVVVNGFQGAEPNLSAFDFEWEQAGYLAGIAAGLTTKSNKLGNIGGVEIPPIQRLFFGFQQGAKAVNPDAEVTETWVGSFTDTGKAGQVAEAQISQGIDTIWAIADTANPGIFEAADKQGAKVIGYGVDESDLAPDATLTTALVDYGKVIFTAVKLANDDQLEPKVYVQSYQDDVFGLAPLNDVDEETTSEIEKLAQEAQEGGVEIEKMPAG
jgi:basic membrane lipoprotein Med (substrate-binding protein (PBP1-ABC) superfamily)